MQSTEPESELFVAPTLRASRAARPPSPTEAAKTRALKRTLETATALESRGLTRAVRTAPPVWQSRALAPRSAGPSMARGAKVQKVDAAAMPKASGQLSHIFSLHSKSLECSARESSWMSYQCVLPLKGVQIVSAAFRSNSVRNSITQRTSSMGGSLQTPRINLANVCAAQWGQAFAVEAARAVAKFVCRERHSLELRDPRATYAPSALSILEAPPQGPFFLATSARLLPHALPTRVASHSLLDTMSRFAHSELNMGTIRQLVPQQLQSLRIVCQSIIDNSEGVSVWCAWSLLAYMISEPRLRRLVGTSRVSDLEAATAAAFLDYARREITRRARHFDSGAAAAETKPEAAEEMAAAAAALVYMEGMKRAAEHSLLSAKRKRGAATGSASTQPSGGFLDWTVAACSSEHIHVLKTLITQSKAAASNAATLTLRAQSSEPSISSNQVVTNMSMSNALRSASVVGGLVVTTGDSVPLAVAWITRTGGREAAAHVGIARSHEDSEHTTIHVAKMAPGRLQPKPHTRVVWSHAIRNTTCPDFANDLVPGIVESTRHLQMIHREIQFDSRHRATMTMDSIRQRIAQHAADGTLDVNLSGIGRGVIVFKAKLCVNTSQIDAGNRMAAQMADFAQENMKGLSHGHRCAAESARMVNYEEFGLSREPFVMGNNLVLGLEATETIRSMLKNRAHRGDPCRHICGLTSAQELAEPTSDDYDRPSSFLPIVDMELEMCGDPSKEPPLPSRPDAVLVDVAVKLTVAGDTPVRLPELLDVLCARRPSSYTEALAHRLQVHSLVMAGGARASEVSDIAHAMLAGHVNSSIVSSKRIVVGDYNARLNLTLWQVYFASVGNVSASFEGSRWRGVYGAGFDMGLAGGVGWKVSSWLADKRHHGSILLYQEQVDALCDELANHHYQQITEDTYATVPVAARGVPRFGYPGLHRYLDDYVAGIEEARALTGTTRNQTVGSLQALPVGPYGDRLPPHCGEGADTNRPFRNAADAIDSAGRAFLLDSTLEDVSIFRGPLWPRVSVVHSTDNICAQSQFYGATFLNAAAVVAMQARTSWLQSGLSPSASAEEQVDRLLEVLKTFHGLAAAPADHLTAATCCPLLNCLYPHTVECCEDVVLPAYAAAPSLLVKRMTFQAEIAKVAPQGVSLCDLGLPRTAVEEATTFFKKFVRADRELAVWTKLRPLLVMLLEADGSYDCSKRQLDVLADALDAAVRAVWLVHSPDGSVRPPHTSCLHECRSMAQVGASHVTPVFVGRLDAFGGREEQRGGVVGLMPATYQSILNSLMGIRLDVQVQACRNEGQLSWRASSAADVLTSKNRERSSKSISCVGVEGDEPAFGSRSEKVKSCKMQRAAWKRNLQLHTPLIVSVSKPRPDDELFRGDSGACEFARQRRQEHGKNGLHVQEEIEAARLFHDAAAAVSLE